MYHLFIDDERTPEMVFWIELPDFPWVIVRSYDEMRAVVDARGLPQTVSYDHDLGPVPMTGYDCARYIMDRVLYDSPVGTTLPVSFVHSMNPVGAEYIRKLIQSYQREIERRGLA